MNPSVATAFVHRQPYLFWAARASSGPRQPRRTRRSAGQPDAPQPADLRHPALRKTVSGRSRRYTLLPGQREDALGRLEYLTGFRLGALKVEALKLVGHLDYAARVDNIVRRVDDAVIGEQLVDSRVGKLVVGAAADDFGPQHGHCIVVDGAAERAGRVHVSVAADQLAPAGGHPHLRILRLHAADGRVADVERRDSGAVGDQVLDQVASDLAHALYGHRAASKRSSAPRVLGSGTHPLEDAQRCQDGRVAGASVRLGATGDMA